MSGPRRGLLARGLVLALPAALLSTAWLAAQVDPHPAAQAAPQADPGPAAQAAPRPDDAELDRLTAEVADQLRCPVCRNQSVLESSSELARSMQGVIRERLAGGESPQEVKAYFVGRYGEWILLKPKARGLNLLVYLLPAVVVLGGGLFVRARLRAWRAARPEAPAADRADRREPTAGRSAKPPAGSEAVAAEADEGLSEPDRDWLEEAIRAG